MTGYSDYLLRVAVKDLSATTEITEKNQKLSLLTPREKEVFDVLALGKSHREIGELLKIVRLQMV
jgi:DNA-binding NarL/FixJ family response regulator